MKFTNALTAAAAIAAAGSIGFVGAPAASADPTTQPFGAQGKLVDAAGNVVQDWTVSNLKVSSDVIPHPVYGTLWEATATDEAVQGGVTPVVSNLNARARSGQTYRVLFGAATPQGVNPATLAQGAKTTGKVYFDVTGDTPDSVVYNAGGQDLLVWVGAPEGSPGGSGKPAPSRGGSAAGSTAAPSTAATPTPGAVPATPAADGTTPATPAPGTPPPGGSSGTPLSTGSTGTPVPAGSQGTPLPAGEGAPVPASVGPANTGTPAGAPANTGTPAGAPESAGSPAPGGAPAAGGSQGTPAPAVAGTPTPTPVVPAPAG